MPTDRITYNERRRERRAAASLIERKPCADPVRREKLERDPAAWLQWYLATAFPLPFGNVHRDIIKAASRAIRTGAGMACAAPRGTGKSTLLWGVALWALLSGQCRFPVVAGWSHTASKRMLKRWLTALAENDRLAADYPDETTPFQSSTHSNKLRGTAWTDTGEVCGADVQTMSGTLTLPDSLGALGAISISGTARGLTATLTDGTTLRPDVLLLDDPQDKATAESPALVRKVVEKIEADLFSLAGPDSRLSVMCAVTIIAEKDVAEHFLTHPDFESVRVGQVLTWPAGWEDETSAARALWEEWNAIRLAGLGTNDAGKECRKFYRANKAALTAGMSVSWPSRFDKKRKDPDAMFAAMLDFYRLGERAFMAERQNAPLQSGEQPLFELPLDHVARRVNGLPRRTAPENAAHLFGFADINADGLRWALGVASNQMSLHVVDYGIYPGGGVPLIQDNETEALGVMRGLSGMDQVLRGLSVMRLGERMPLDLFLIDCGGVWMQSVFDWLGTTGRASPVPWFASRGAGGKFYRPNRNIIGRPGDGWHVARWQGKGMVLVHDADRWRHRQQKGWSLPVGAPDSISIFGNESSRHDVFATGVCAEKLVAYVETPAGPLYKWSMTPGMRNDFGDVATGLFVAASRLGLTPAGRIRQPRRKVIKPRIQWVSHR